MSWRFNWRPYVSAAQKRANAAREASKLTKSGRQMSPVTVGRNIAATFWGKAWCENLESYSDYSNRLPRGRSYARNGSIIDLQISPGLVEALVCGSSLYKIKISITPLSKPLWKRVQSACAGQIDSLIGLLQGRLSDSVMKVVTDPANGLFPKPSQISLACSCPDWASMCKHVAACLYGVGGRLDEQPDLLFALRGVDPAELISQASAADAIQPRHANGTAKGGTTIAEGELAEVFGIELDTAPAVTQAAPRKTRRPRQPGKKAKPAAKRPARGQAKPKSAGKPKRKGRRSAASK